ncbi:SdrD B-like domain-containing protein [Arcicella sp. LKC2W]|uniref:Ig-like domain-containing protein n=1 Tax=Arcicella sp. LKC2W TaxID=2984198 RepID=UPI002B1ECE5D|nr:SdrD B-like domain-containing protein [Arcicella sp. LKC2W]MEA5459529.1 SdrD B-like domain-containing protein [Arcicella sp. LKC2W]
MFFFLFSASMQTFSQNLLSNNSFDSGTTGWSASPSGSIFTFSGQYAYSGNALTLNNNDNWGNYYTWQSITATAGIKYNISFMASTHNPVYYAAVGYEFYNSSGIIIGSRVEKRVTGSVYNSSGYSKYEFLGVTAPTGTTKLRVVGYTNGTALKLDNISVSLTSTCSNVTSGGTIGSNQTGCSGFDPVTFTSVTAPAGGAGTLEIIWMKSTTSSVLNSTTQSQWTVIPGATGLTYDAGPITQTTYFTRCSRRAGCTAYVGEANVITATVNANCQGKDPVCLSRKSAVSSSSLCGDATKSYGLWFNDLKSSNNVTCPSQYFTVKSGELTEFCDGTAILKVVGCVTGGGASDCITATVNYSGRTGTPPTGSPLTNTHCSGYAPNVGNWYYYPTSNGTFSGTGIFAGLAGTYTQNMAAFQVGTGGSLNDISKFGASSWFKINLTSGGTNNWTTASKDGDININLGTATNIASVTATANPNSICKGSNVVLTATLDAASKSASCSPTYSWVGSNGFTSTQATVTNTSVQTATTYTVTVTFTAKNGSKCSVTGTTAVALSANCCDNVTNGGQIGGNQRNCGAFDPAAFTNVTLPSGGTGTLEYLWLKSTTASTYTDANASEWIPIVGSNSATLDLNNISQTTYFQRCSRRAGCSDYVGETNVVSVIIDPLPTAPTVTPASICGTGTVTLGATCGTGTTAMWYSALTGGTSIASGASFTTPSLSATTTYYVSCKSSAGCESGRTSVKATVTPKITDGGKIQADETICTGSTPSKITNVTLPNGGVGSIEYLWLQTTSLTNGVCPANIAGQTLYSPIANTNTSEYQPGAITTTTCYIRCSRLAGCTDYTGESNVIKKTVGSIGVAPTVTAGTVCGTGTVTLGATCGTGTTAMWYSALTGGTSIASGASFTTPSLSATTTYYVSCKSSAGCESGKTSVVATVTPKITDGGKIQADETICTGSTPSKITNVTLPNGGVGSIEYLWLQTTSLTNGVCPANIAGQTLYSPISNSNGSEYQPGAITTTTCYIRCSRLTGCTDYTGESNVIKKTVGSIGVAPTVTPASICGTGTVTLGATCGTGTTAMWYSALTGGTSIASGASFTTPSLSATTTYYVSCKSSAGCESGRTSVKATVTPKITDGGKIQADETICTGSTPSKITNVTLPNGGLGSIEYLWLQTTSLTNGVCPANIAGQTLYSPIANTNTSEYQPGAITTTTCFIRCSRLTGCTDYTGESNVIKKTVGSIGVAPTVTAGTVCGTGTVTLGATCGTGTTAMWYSALTGGTSIASGASFTTPSLSATTTYYVSCKSSAGCESGRTSVVATVNGGAAAPTVTPASICGTGTVTLGATCSTGATAMWYSALTGGTSIASGVTYTTPSLTATTTYYVSCKSSAGCESARTSVVATVNGSLSGPSAIKNGTICGNGTVELGAVCTTGTPMWYATATGGTSFTTGSVYVTPVLTTTTSYYVSCKSTAGCESLRIEVKATVIAKITNGGTIQADESICLGKTPAQITSVTPATGGDANAAIEYIWLQTTALSNGACPLNVVGQNLYTEIPNSNTPNYQPGAITQTTCYIRCARRAGCTDYIGGESNTVKKSVLANCEGKDPVCLSRKTTVSNSTLCGDATQSYGLYFADLKGNVVSPNQHFTVKSGELTEFCDGTAVLNYTACVTGGTSSDCINVIVNYSGRTGTPPTGSPVANTHCTGYSPNLGDWYYYPTSNGTFTGAGIYAGLTGTYTQNMAAFQLGTGASLNDITKFGASSWFKINITNGGTNNWTTVSKDGDINVTLGTPTTIASVTATANPTAICTGGDVNLTATLDANSKSINCTPTYSWVGSNGFTSTQATVTNTNVTASTTYTITVTFTAANGSKCSVMATTGVTINPTPATPTVASGSICGTGTVTLAATCSTGATAMWYSALTGGTSIASGASFTTPSLSASTTYYVSCKSNAGCESARTPVTATVNGSASAPTVTPATTCGAGSVTLGATCSAGVATWYSALTGGTAIASGASYTTPNLTTTTTYYVSCKAGTGCESARTAVVATVVAKITNGGTIKADETLCGSGTPAKITNVTLPSGGDVNAAIEYVWLQTTTLSNGACPLNIIGQNLYTEIPNSNTADYQPGAITQTTCYIRCARRAGCTDYIGGESNTVKKTVGSASSAPTVTSGSICGTGTVTLGATCSTGATAMWYSALTGGTSMASGASFTTPSLSASTTYYVSCKSNAGCESARTPVTATVNGSASAPTVTPATTCGAGSVTLGATCSAGVATWYSALTGGTAIASGASYTTPNLTTTTTYYVSCKAGTGCESARTAVVATVVAKITNGGTIKADETLCGSGTPAKITNVTLPSGGDVNAAIEYVWLQTTTLSNGACPLNIIGQNLYTEIPNSNTADYQPGAITQTTCYIRCARRAGCTDYIGGESNTVKKTVTTPFTVTPSTNANAVCAGTTVSITLSTTATGTVSYSWTGLNGFTANTKDVVIANSTIANNGVYTVSVSNGTGCSAVATVNVKITNCLKLGDAVFNDKNNNGKQDAGELGIANVSVKLYDSANNLVGTATTDANGKYLFSNLAPNDYVVEISAPTGYKSSTGTVGSATGSAEPAVAPDNNVDGDDNGTTISGQTIRTKPVTLTVAGGDNLTVDFGLFKPAQIGDYVFRDSNGNGKQDVGEGGVSGVTVKLYDSANNVIATTTTDANGKYLFDNLIAGNYIVEFVKSTIGSGFNFSPKGATTSDKDSDADLTTGKTTVITLTEGQVNKDIDAGVTTPCDTDTTPPVLSTCPADIIIKTRGTSAIITWTEPTATDNCGTVVLTSTSVSGGQFPVGTTTVIYTATDAKGNKATCSFVVNVVKMVTCDVDTQAPVFYDCPTDISVVTTGTTAVVLWDHPAVGDNCGIPEITYNFEPGMLFPVGITTVTYKAVDAKGNTSYCSFKVTVTKKTTTSTITNAAARVAVTEEVTFADNVTIYPNPSNADCSIELSAELMRANKSVEVSILSAAGNVEFAQTATGTERTSVKVPVENMPSGTYFVNVGLENGRMIIKKLQIVK